MQGGLNQQLREQSVKGNLTLLNRTIFVYKFFCDFLEIVKRDCPGYAIGGLSGGEDKDQFWRMVTLSSDYLPKTKPRYLMGVGFVYLIVN